MIIASLKKITEMCNGKLNDKSYENIKITGVSTDTRTIEKNNLFVPIVGEHFDGNDYIDKAFEKGASASLLSNFVFKSCNFPLIEVEDTTEAFLLLAENYRKGLSLEAVGITGTNGKTTTKDLIYSIMSTTFRTQKTEKNYNNYIGLSHTVLNLNEDTQVAVIEMGTERFGEIDRLSKVVSPKMGILTNVGDCHLLELKNKDNVCEAKLEMLAGIKKDGIFLYNGDDETILKHIKEKSFSQKLLSFGFNEDNDYVIKVLNSDNSGSKFLLNDEEFFIPFMGKHQIYNAAAAVIAGKVFNVAVENIKAGLVSAKLTDMRNELIKVKDFSILNDAYKSNPQSLEAALDILSDISGYSKKIAVLGDMLGLDEKEAEFHRNAGKKIDKDKIDMIFTIGNLGLEIGNGAVEAGFDERKVKNFKDIESLYEELKNHIIENSIILVKASRYLYLENLVEKLKEFEI